jgi:hypothetical protein
MRLFNVLFVFLASAIGVGCAGTGTVQYGATASYDTPDLVDVSPGVQVVADYDEPIFFSDGFYWRYDNGGWYRSNNYANGFVYWDSPPSAVISIGQPERYRHYRPAGYVARRHAERRPEPIRDHRQVRNERVEQPTPVVRDHREPMPREQPRPVEQRREEPRREQPRPVEQRREEPARQAAPRQVPPKQAPSRDDKKHHEH